MHLTARPHSSSAPKKQLSLFDSTSIIVGIIIGAGIFETAPTVARSAGSVAATLTVWLIGGLVALAGALCYAELASSYPQEGGDYVYLSRAYGRLAGYLFGWSQLAIIRPGDIALMSFVFGRYFRTLYDPFGESQLVYAAGATATLTAINILGVKSSKWTQNVLTAVKVLGVALIVIAGLLAPGDHPSVPQTGPELSGIKLALILVLFTYGGWNEMAYAAAEVKNPDRNILRSLALGTGIVILVYLTVNVAFFRALGFAGVQNSSAVAVDTVARVFPGLAERFVAVLICISALGAVNGLTFTGARIGYALGTEHPVFAALGSWSSHFGTPARALALQGLLSVAIVLLAGSFVDTILYSAPAVWAFFLATTVSLFRLRQKEPQRRRPYRVSGYPWVPTIFALFSAFMLYASLTYAFHERLPALGILMLVFAIGAGLYAFTNGQKPKKSNPAGSSNRS